MTDNTRPPVLIPQNEVQRLICRLAETGLSQAQVDHPMEDNCSASHHSTAEGNGHIAEALTVEEWAQLIRCHTEEDHQFLFDLATQRRQQFYGNTIYIRGLIEFTNYCKNDCLYCGIRRGNPKAQRYRLTKQQILECCKLGYDLGFRTFVLQGGEDPGFTDDTMTQLIYNIKEEFPDCALTLSAGERSETVYRQWFAAGADRYLLRHETADASHYAKLHPQDQTLRSRIQCLENLKAIGYQVGCGFMVGSPFQTAEHLAKDLMFLWEFRPHMVGIGPFIPHKDTPFAAQPAGTLELTLFLLGLIRLMLPRVLLPATTALGTIHPQGRELGIRAGANVIMPNLSPADVRDKYTLYNNKLHTGCEAAEHLSDLRQRMAAIGCEIAVSRGDSLM